MGFLIIWLIVFVVWNLVISIRIRLAFKELNDQTDWINQDIKNRLGKKEGK